ncbi:C39 family peptidase [Peribacillus sp. NPDC097284]|uniref:C39 family peptidase n=1 Tax=Peribacillus sp. NPDC097284 TaxID=3364401 RepID=UPI00381664A9
MSQNPELKYGCEVTSLAMFLQFAGIKVDKMQLADKIKKDNEPLFTNKEGDIVRWGDPNKGFVGDITGKTKGCAIYVEPFQDLIKQYLPHRTMNLTGESFNDVLNQVQMKKPIVVATTGDYKTPDRWESWRCDSKEIVTPLYFHAVALVGFEGDYVYINDPLSGKKHKR